MNLFSFLGRKNFLLFSSLPVLTGFLVLPPLSVELSQMDENGTSNSIQVSSTVEVLMPEMARDLPENTQEVVIFEPKLEIKTVMDENPETMDSVIDPEQENQLNLPSSVEEEETVDEPQITIEPEEDPLDFATTRIKKMKAIDPAYVAVLIQNEVGESEIWFYDFYNYIQRDVGDRIGTSEQVLKNSPLGAKGRFFFWRGNNTIFAFDAVAQKLHSKEFYGESGRVCFEECSFDVILRNNEFYFYSQKTGEVFSDDDSALRWQLYIMHLKNLPESREDLVEQNFTVLDKAL